MTIRRQLLLWYTGIMAISGLLLMVSLYWFASHQLHREADKFLEDEFDGWTLICRNYGYDVDSIRKELAPELAGSNYFPIFIRLYDKQSREEVFTLSIRNHGKLPPLALPDSKPGEKILSSFEGAPGKEYRLLTMALDEKHVLQGGIYIRRINDRLARLRVYVISATAAALFLGVGGGLILTRRSLAPMDALIADMERIEAEALSQRLAVPESSDEVAHLRRALNRMLDRLENAFARINNFTADAAHELRTPLAKLQCRLQVAVEKVRTEEEHRLVLADALQETAELTHMVNDLLFLAQIDARAERPAMAPVSVKTLLEELHEPFSLAAQEKSLVLTLEAKDDCVILGENRLLRRLFGNLIDNALRYTPPGGKINVTVGREGMNCVVRVSDTGIGIAPEAMAGIFERFYRADIARSRNAGGAGLGLSICRSIVGLHRGEIRVESKQHEGSMFEVRLPA